MLIVAKFNSTCPVCNEYINAGENVEWTKGQKAKHPSCARGGSKPVTRPVRSRSTSTTKPPRQEGELSGKYESIRDGKETAHVGETCWLKKMGNRIPVTVVGWATRYVREDGLSFGYPDDSGWFTHVYFRDATEDEAAPLRQREQAAKDKAQAAKAAQERSKAEYEAKKAEATKGLVKTSCSPQQFPAQVGETVSYKDGSTSLWFCVFEDGSVQDSFSLGSDFWGDEYWATPERVRELVREWATKNGIDSAKAREFLEKYSGCQGADDYRLVLEMGL